MSQTVLRKLGNRVSYHFGDRDVPPPLAEVNALQAPRVWCRD